MIAFSPVRQDPAVLELFLSCMDGELWVYDDNTDPESSALLREADCRILNPIELPESTYRRGDDTHHWDDSTILRVAAIKNYAIDLFLETDQEHLFLIDSDVLLPHGAVDHLKEADERVIAGIYWTSWHPGSPRMPNAFGLGVDALKRPGHHPVGGTGACTLIRRDVFRYATFREITHLRGEDRWFCWLCHKANIQTVACTHLDIFHVYRSGDIEEGRRFADHRPAQLV